MQPVKVVLPLLILSSTVDRAFLISPAIFEYKVGPMSGTVFWICSIQCPVCMDSTSAENAVDNKNVYTDRSSHKNDQMFWTYNVWTSEMSQLHWWSMELLKHGHLGDGIAAVCWVGNKRIGTLQCLQLTVHHIFLWNKKGKMPSLLTTDI